MGTGAGESEQHSMERASSADSWHHHHAAAAAAAAAVGAGGAVIGSMVRSVPAPRFDRQRAMAAAALEEGEAEESLPSSGSPLTHQRAGTARSAPYGRDAIKL